MKDCTDIHAPFEISSKSQCDHTSIKRQESGNQFEVIIQFVYRRPVCITVATKSLEMMNLSSAGLFLEVVTKKPGEGAGLVAFSDFLLIRQEQLPCYCCYGCP